MQLPPPPQVRLRDADRADVRCEAEARSKSRCRKADVATKDTPQCRLDMSFVHMSSVYGPDYINTHDCCQVEKIIKDDVDTCRSRPARGVIRQPRGSTL